MKQYKLGLKGAETILKKFPAHGGIHIGLDRLIAFLFDFRDIVQLLMALALFSPFADRSQNHWP
jgi:hypothetical protein